MNMKHYIMAHVALYNLSCSFAFHMKSNENTPIFYFNSGTQRQYLHINYLPKLKIQLLNTDSDIITFARLLVSGETMSRINSSDISKSNNSRSSIKFEDVSLIVSAEFLVIFIGVLFQPNIFTKTQNKTLTEHVIIVTLVESLLVYGLILLQSTFVVYIFFCFLGQLISKNTFKHI